MERHTKQKPHIFFHIGLERTGTKFLKHNVFPKFKDIYFIKKGNILYRESALSDIKADKLLISHEYGKSFMDNVLKLAELFPYAGIILVLRRQDKWIASQYKRYVKKGYPYPFSEFFDVENNKGRWKREELFFYPIIETIRKNFYKAPLVLFHDELKSNPWEFINKIAHYTRAHYNSNSISLKPKHTSYSENQLVIKRRANNTLLLKEKSIKNKSLPYRLLRYRNKLIRYCTLKAASVIPSGMLTNEQFIPEELLQNIRSYYQDDWQKCLREKN